MKENCCALFCAKVVHTCCYKENCRGRFTVPFIKAGFSLVEMLMALLVASLLLAALAPVITRKVDGSKITINGFFDPNNNTVKEEIIFDSLQCPGGDKIKTAADGSEYCEGTYRVPSEYNGIIRVTVIGAGGGGGAAPTAGFTEFKDAGSINNFTVPAMVNKLETTLIGGAPGGNPPEDRLEYRIFKHPNTPKIMYDGVHYAPDKNIVETKSDGTCNWNPLNDSCNGGGESIFNIIKGTQTAIAACGGGGGGGGNKGDICYNGVCAASGGGGAGYYAEGVPYIMRSSFPVTIGGAGGGGGRTSELTTDNTGYNGGPRAGGGGGGGRINGDSGYGGNGGQSGGAGGTFFRTGYGKEGGAANSGESNVTSGSSIWTTSTCDTSNPLSCPNFSGGKPNGGNVNMKAYLPTSTTYNMFYGGGGGGGSLTMGYGGGGGGSSYHGGGGGGGGAASHIDLPGVGYQWPGGGGGGGGCELNSYAGLTTGGGGGGGGVYGERSTNGGNAAICSVLTSPSVIINGAAGVGLGSAASGTNPGIHTVNIFGPDFCNGGAGVPKGVSGHGESGKPGAMKIEYVTSTEGGYGGSPAIPIELRALNVTEKQLLSVTVGKGTEGGKAPKIKLDGSSLKLEGGTGAAFGNPTIIKDKNSNTKLLETERNLANIVGGGASNGYQGGTGGALKTVFTSCEPAEGGKILGQKAADATGYGCGGGGAHSLSDAGNGSGGYARLSWNKYWDRATKVYKLANIGAGGGGASGNIMVYSIKVMGGQVIDIKIGKGGKGAKIVNNNLVASQKGGDTVFGNSAIGEIRAGGGNGGGSPAIVNNNVTNGAGGSISTTCHYSGKSLFNNSLYCTKGSAGFTPITNSLVNGILNGADGASMPNFGEGGEGGISGTNKYQGNNASGFGSGGGGAGIHDLGNNSIDSLNGGNEGGSGSNGKIIIELFEN